MSRDSEVTSEHTSSVHMGSDDNHTNQSRLEYMSDGSSVSKRELASNPPSGEASPSRRRLREVILSNDWSVHDFPIDISDEVFSRLRPRFQIPDDVPIRKGHNGEKYYTGVRQTALLAPLLVWNLVRSLLTPVAMALVAALRLPLLVKDKDYIVNTAYSIIRDADLDECSKHETDPLGDSDLFYLMKVCCSTIAPSLLIFIRYLSITFIPFGQGLVRMQALQIRCAAREALVKHLRNRLETKSESLKQFKETSLTLGQEMIELKAKLSWVTHQTDELMKENANLKSKVATLHKHMDKVKKEAIEEFRVSQPYFNKMGDYYGGAFKDFCKQAVLMFLDLDFS
nr:hypothetical protein CFP56_62359 [Quercus suber]